MEITGHTLASQYQPIKQHKIVKPVTPYNGTAKV